MFCVITDEEAKIAFHELLDLEKPDEEFRPHLCCLLIAHTWDALELRLAFDQAAWIEDRELRNKVWLEAIKKRD